MIILKPYSSKNFQIVNQYFHKTEIAKYTNGGRYRLLSLFAIYKSHFYLLWDGDKVIGCGVIRWKWSREMHKFGWWLYAIWVNPHYRGKGYGKVLMQELIAEIRKRNIKKVNLTVSKENIVARNLYGYMGFIQVDSTEQDIIMQYDL